MFLIITSTNMYLAYLHSARPCLRAGYLALDDQQYMVLPLKRNQTHSQSVSSVAQSCLTLCNPVNCSTPGLSVHHQLPEFPQTHVHWVGDAIQPSYLWSSPSPPAFNLSQHQDLFQWISSSHQVAKVVELPLQHQSFQWIFRADFLFDWLVGFPCSSGDSRVFSNTTVQKHQFFSAQLSSQSNSHTHTWLLEKP